MFRQLSVPFHIWSVPRENQHCRLRKVSTRMVSMLRRLTRTDTFHLLWTLCFRNHYSITETECVGPEYPAPDCAGWSASLHYAESMMLVFWWNSSYIDMSGRHKDVCKVIVKMKHHLVLQTFSFILRTIYFRKFLFSICARVRFLLFWRNKMGKEDAIRPKPVNI